jgi:DnaJ domain
MATRRRIHRTQENDFFNELLDAVVDAVVDTAEPYIDKLAKEAVGNARRLVDQQAATQPRATRTRRATHNPPPPQPPPPRHQPQPTLYDILQVTPHADLETIQAAYKSLAQRYHPDKRPGDKKAEAMMKEITNAYSVLKREGTRLAYDRKVGLCNGG